MDHFSYRGAVNKNGTLYQHKKMQNQHLSDFIKYF